MVTFIVSAFEKPLTLNCCLASLNAQKGMEIEIIVACNSRGDGVCVAHDLAAMYFEARVIHTGRMGAGDCYSAAEIVVREARGEWLCFPSDDSYYVPTFLERMIETATTNSWEFVYCDMLYASRWTRGEYRVMNVQPKRGAIDKTCFMVRRDKFPDTGFPGRAGGGKACEADGELAEYLAGTCRHGKAPGGALVVHS